MVILVSNHGGAKARNHGGILGQVNPTLEAIVESSFATAPGQNLSKHFEGLNKVMKEDLGFDDVLITRKVGGDGSSFSVVGSHSELLDSDPVVLEQALGLVLQQVQIPQRNRVL